MSSPRLRRLQSDYEDIRARFDGHPVIRAEALGTVPPERYRLTYQVPSLRLNAENKPIVHNTTVVDMELPSGYPREKPRAVAHGAVFHPNFGDYVCIADFWSPAQKLSDIVIEIGEMLQWQKYNIQSPLNAVAADWAVKHTAELPIGRHELSQATVEIDLQLRPQAQEEGARNGE